MTTKQYEYKVLHQNGDIEGWKSTKMDFADFRQQLKCQMIEIIPKDYYPVELCKGWTAYGDEEGRFNTENHRNPHFKVLTDPDGGQWDVVGDIIFERKVKAVA